MLTPRPPTLTSALSRTWLSKVRMPSSGVAALFVSWLVTPAAVTLTTEGTLIIGVARPPLLGEAILVVAVARITAPVAWTSASHPLVAGTRTTEEGLATEATPTTAWLRGVTATLMAVVVETLTTASVVWRRATHPHVVATRTIVS